MIAPECILRAKKYVTTGGYIAPDQLRAPGTILVLAPDEAVRGYRSCGYDNPMRKSWLVKTDRFSHVVEVFEDDVEVLICKRVEKDAVPEDFHPYLFPDHRGLVTVPGFRAD